MRAAGENRAGLRLRAIIVVLWRAGLRISEALALAETDLDHARGSIQVRHGKGGRGREVGIDPWAFEQLIGHPRFYGAAAGRVGLDRRRERASAACPIEGQVETSPSRRGGVPRAATGRSPYVRASQ